MNSSLRTTPPARVPAGPCLDANDVAALCGSSLPDDERDALAAHLGECAACREWMGATGAAGAAVDGATNEAALAGCAPKSILTLRGPARWAPLALAAAMLLAIGVAIARSPRLEATSGLAAEASRVGAAYLSASALAERPRGAERGGIAVLSPRGTVATARPAIVWTAVPGATSARVTVRDAEGVLRLDATSTKSSLAWPGDRPALAPGATYVVRVAVTTPAGDTSGSESFRVPSVAEGERFASAITRIASAGRPAWKALLCAHEAAAAERWAEADVFLAKAMVDGAPAADVGALRALVDHQLGRAGP